MSIQDIGVAVAILSALGGVLIQLIKVIASQIIDTKIETKFKELELKTKEFRLKTDEGFKDIYKEFEDIEKEFIKQGDRSARIERRLAVLQTKTTGNTDTFGSS